MTSPQQPDEVRLMDRCCMDAAVPVASECEPRRCPVGRPAAPSAQLDEVDDEPCEDCWWELNGEPCSYHADHPAQPVRDTGARS